MSTFRTVVAAAFAAFVIAFNLHNVQLEQAIASQDATAAWNTYCTACEFAPLTGTTPTTWTFTDAWNGFGGTHIRTFAQDDTAITAAINGALSAGHEDDTGGTVFVATVQNW